MDGWRAAVSAKGSEGPKGAYTTGYRAGDPRFAEAVGKILEYEQLAVDRCSTWVPHPVRWRRWLGQQKRIVNHTALLAELHHIKNERA